MIGDEEEELGMRSDGRLERCVERLTREERM